MDYPQVQLSDYAQEHLRPIATRDDCLNLGYPNGWADAMEFVLEGAREVGCEVWLTRYSNTLEATVLILVKDQVSSETMGASTPHALMTIAAMLGLMLRWKPLWAAEAVAEQETSPAAEQTTVQPCTACPLDAERRLSRVECLLGISPDGTANGNTGSASTIGSTGTIGVAGATGSAGTPAEDTVTPEDITTGAAWVEYSNLGFSEVDPMQLQHFCRIYACVERLPGFVLTCRKAQPEAGLSGRRVADTYNCSYYRPKQLYAKNGKLLFLKADDAYNTSTPHRKHRDEQGGFTWFFNLPQDLPRLEAFVKRDERIYQTGNPYYWRSMAL